MPNATTQITHHPTISQGGQAAVATRIEGGWKTPRNERRSSHATGIYRGEAREV